MSISSPSNSRIKRARALYGRKHRQVRGELLLEGGRSISEALGAGAHIVSCFYTDAALGRWQSLLQELERDGTELISVTERVMETLGDTVTPQGLVAVAAAPAEAGPSVFAEERLVLVADRIGDPGNLGTMLRTAAAIGAAMVLTAGCVDFTGPKVVRSSAGAIYSIPVWSNARHAEVVAEARAEGYRLAVCDASGAVAHYEVDLTGAVAVVVGNEAHGPAPDWQAADHVFAHIPMPGRAESLNAAVAAAIVLYESLRQRRTDPC
ncbi:MAG: TrmH family RNA methyltransferase [Limnochordia bacterium]|jgi:TrmH family RNA methyltransferase